MSDSHKRGRGQDDEDADEQGLDCPIPLKKHRPNNNNNNTGEDVKNNEEQGQHNGHDGNPLHPNKIITLDVGGIKYKTTIRTLTSYDSMLKARFSSRFRMQPEADGTYFIDRDGKLFEYILEYLRNGTLALPDSWTRSDIYKFYMEAQYFALTPLFDITLPRLFESKLITNHTFKLKLMEVLGARVFGCTARDILRTAKDWKLLFEYDQLKFEKENEPGPSRDPDSVLSTFSILQSSCRRSLLLVQCFSEIFGVLLTMEVMEPRGTSPYQWRWELDKCIAFRCGPNSAHESSSLKIECTAVRELTSVEIALLSDDEEDCGFLYIYPIFIQYFKATGVCECAYFCGDEDYDELEKMDFDLIQKMECWSITI